jgi:hypothetical protein
VALTQRERDQRRAEKAKADRAALIAELGGECVDCGTKERLEFDHTAPREWDCKRPARWQRMRLYRREAAAGLIVLRCRSCNARKGKPEPTGECGFCGAHVPEGGVCGCAN